MTKRPACAECGQLIDGPTATYDDHADNYFCNDSCFDDWAERHAERIERFYAEMNTQQLTLD